MTLRSKTPLFWKKHPKLITQIKKDHLENASRTQGHDFLHALIVASLAAQIAENKKTKELVWLAGLLHNTDRLFGKNKTQQILNERLNLIAELSSTEKQQIIEAIEKHDQFNKKDDSLITQILMDADRIANMGPDGFMRAGRFHALLPVFDPRYLGKLKKGASYTKRSTAFDWLVHALEWNTKPLVRLRLEKSKHIAKPLVSFLHSCLTLTKHELKKAGLLPFPKEIIREKNPQPGLGFASSPQTERAEVILENHAQLNKAAIILVIGVPGSGKSTVAKALAEKIPNTSYISKDLIQNAFTNQRVTGQDYENIRLPTQKLLLTFSETQLQLKKSPIIDAPYSINAWRKDAYADFAAHFRKIADLYHTKLIVVLCKAPSEQELKRRISKRNYPWDSWKLKNWAEYMKQEPQNIKINHNTVVTVTTNTKTEKLVNKIINFTKSALQD